MQKFRKKQKQSITVVILLLLEGNKMHLAHKMNSMK